ncbi:MMPL family transporter [Conexibacter sp. SYSU D00693]|uniref:MMPL family transporter n=1 Tax=Conexibacter sp. SYSU D00693 TaxID=2812560 RepID=UPI00196B8B1F|nr:MMPL family transporter [Conexibacter sp. SYSU D00693]
MLERFLALPAGRRSKWAVLGFWLVAVIAIMATDLPSKYADAEKNESTSFLPGDAESTKALEVTKRLQGGELAPTVVVFQRDGGLRPADREAIARDTAQLNARAFRGTTRFGEPTLSRDGSTALISNTIRSDGESDTLLDPVDHYREVLRTEDRDDGLQVKVTGPSGVSADAIKVFEDINGTLILAAGLLVFVLLILIYRSPIFWFFPLFSVIVAELVSRGGGYGLTELGVTVNGQTSSIASILVLGAGTDYALLLVARYREELRRHEDKHEAMALALRTAGPAVIASALTVAIALLALVLAKVNGTAGMGPVGAFSIVVALLVQLTFLPALLVAVGRRPFWPFVPRLGDEGVDETHGVWRRVGERVAARPRRVWLGTVALLALCAVGLLNFSSGLTQGNSFRDSVESIEGQELVAAAFPAGQSAPLDVVVRDPGRAQAVGAAVAQVDGVADVRPTGQQGAEGVLLAAALDVDPYSTEAFDLVPKVREAAAAAAPGTLVGGSSAVEADVRDASERDTLLLIPITLVVVFLILLVLLRAVTATLLLMGTVVLSFAAALGIGSIVFDVVFGFPGADPSIPLFAFIFLVALGVDYNIFLMARVREETAKHGTRDGMLRGLAVTGGVITSAGIVLAGTFSVLAALPLVFLTEIGFVIAFGVLLDTFLVRSVLVPALVLDVGPKVWWPSRLAREEAVRGPATDPPHGTVAG